VGEDPQPPAQAGTPRELASGKLLVDEPAPGVARLRISNPEKRGALDHELLGALASAARDIDARCLVLTGDGPMFSAGYDIGDFRDEERFAADAEQLVAHPFHDAIEALESYPYPAIAALNGHAIGGGLELALTCDIRIAAAGAKLGMPPARIGLVYSHTGLAKFVEACGPQHTAELFHHGRNVDAERAAAIGLVNHVVEPEELEARSLEMAEEIAANAPLSLAGNKRIMRELRRHPGTLPDELERQLVELREACFRSEDFREGVRAFAEKRDPSWKGR
jgi:enoyl-CoA hydratase/carnithine racemase